MAPADTAPDDAEFLRSYLARRDVPCPGCRYNLRGLTDDICPECAQQLRLGVGLVDPRLGLFLTGLIGISIGLGFSGIVLLWAIALYVQRIGGPNMQELAPLIFGAVVGSATLWIWLRTRSLYRRLGFPARLALTAAVWTLSAVFPIWFFAMF